MVAQRGVFDRVCLLPSAHRIGVAGGDCYFARDREAVEMGRLCLIFLDAINRSFLHSDLSTPPANSVLRQRLRLPLRPRQTLVGVCVLVFSTSLLLSARNFHSRSLSLAAVRVVEVYRRDYHFRVRCLGVRGGALARDK